nr:hypothetical protein [uncultured Friedmanniella sp.]
MTQSPTVWIESEAARVAPAGSVGWALDFLRQAARDRGVRLTSSATEADHHVLVAAPGGSLAGQALQATAAPGRLPAESFAMARLPVAGAETLVVVGADPAGLVYALLELSDVLRCADSPATALSSVPPRYEHPHAPVRSLSRMFACQQTDLAWFHDRAFWDEYLTELAMQRFNRFSLGFGLAYDYLIDKRVTDNYFCFLYPFLLSVPGYDVAVAGLTEDERRRNLESLQYIAAATARRGLEFSLGLWNHAYRLDPVTPSEKWLISGLDESSHAAYCSEALVLLLRACPEISALTFRVHFEGGVPEPTHEFWRVVTGALAKVDRPIRLDAHAKGVNDQLLEVLGSHGVPFTLSTKYWGEHMGLPYHQASIRPREFGVRGSEADNPNAGRGLSGAAVTRRRSFTRYGYADYARDDTGYGLLHRVWPGTQRVLLWGDPAMAAGIGRQSLFAGSQGIEWFEPLTFLGRKDSAAHPLQQQPPRTDRDLYAEPDLSLPGVSSWKKYRYTFRLWGRLSYNPDADPETWRRYLRSSFGPGAGDCEAAIGSASRILPLVMTTHAPSVAGNIYWPEMYTNIPLVATDPPIHNPFAEFGWQLNAHFDMTAPYTFGNTSTLDPQLFATPDEYADSLLDGVPTAKYSPLEVADWLDRLAEVALERLRAARQHTDPTADFRRLAVDVEVQAHLGQFFAAKFRAAVAWRWHQRTADPPSLDSALDAYRSARSAWQRAAAAADLYQPDLPFGRMPYQRGHWADRLPAIEEDVAALADHAGGESCLTHADRSAQFPGPARRIEFEVGHLPPTAFQKGEPLRLSFTAPAEPGLAVRLHYRHVDQSTSWLVTSTVAEGNRFSVDLPAEFTDSPYSIQYFVEVRSPAGTGLHPPLDPVHLSNQPYFVVHADPNLRWGRTATQPNTNP